MASLIHRAPIYGFALVCLAQPLRATLVDVSQTRTLDTTSKAKLGNTINTDADAAVSPDFSLFDREIGSSSFLTSISPAATMLGTGSAKQKSSLGPNVLSVYGEAVTTVATISGSNSSAGGTAKSYFQYEFQVLNPHTFTLNGTLNTEGIVSGAAALPTTDNSFIFENVTTSSILFSSLTDDENFLVSGLLSPGTYRLTAVATVDSDVTAIRTGARNASGFSSFDFTLRAQNLPESGTGSSVLVLGALGGLTLWNRRRRSGAPA